MCPGISKDRRGFNKESLAEQGFEATVTDLAEQKIRSILH